MHYLIHENMVVARECLELILLAGEVLKLYKIQWRVLKIALAGSWNYRHFLRECPSGGRKYGIKSIVICVSRTYNSTKTKQRQYFYKHCRISIFWETELSQQECSHKQKQKKHQKASTKNTTKRERIPL